MTRHSKRDHCVEVHKPVMSITDTNKPFACTFTGCKMAYKTLGWLTRHVNLAHKAHGVPPKGNAREPCQNYDSDAQLKCFVCGKTYTTLRWLTRHTNSCFPVVGATCLSFVPTRVAAEGTGRKSIRRIPPGHSGVSIEPQTVEPVFVCPFEGCGKAYRVEKSLLNHGYNIHGFSFCKGTEKGKRRR